MVQNTNDTLDTLVFKTLDQRQIHCDTANQGFAMICLLIKEN